MGRAVCGGRRWACSERRPTSESRGGRHLQGPQAVSPLLENQGRFHGVESRSLWAGNARPGGGTKNCFLLSLVLGDSHAMGLPPQAWSKAGLLEGLG